MLCSPQRTVALRGVGKGPIPRGGRRYPNRRERLLNDSIGSTASLGACKFRGRAFEISDYYNLRFWVFPRPGTGGFFPERADFEELSIHSPRPTLG